MRRLFPVPFRMVEDAQQFKKWQWVEVRVEKAPKDHRPESHKVYVDTIRCGEVLDTKNAWARRWQWLDKTPNFTSFSSIEATHAADGLPLALLRPKRLLGLDITKARHAAGPTKSGRSSFTTKCRETYFPRLSSDGN